MSIILTNYNLFGTNERGFINAIKHYSDIKGGYDAVISSYGTAAYTVRPLADNKGTIPVRNDISFSRMKAELPGLEKDREALAFKFFIPLKKGFQVSVNAELISWDGSEVLASIRDKTGKYIEHRDSENSKDLITKVNMDNYAYLPIILKGVPSDDPDNPNNFLQSKIDRWRNKNSDESRKLFILRVWQMVWPADMTKCSIKSKDFEVRDDSIVLEIKD